MNYDEAIDTNVSATEAQAEILKHDCCFFDFVTEYGIHDWYAGSDVLGWLGD